MADFFPISPDRAGEAYAAAVLRCRQYQFAAEARRTIAAAFSGAYCTKAIEPKLAALFPDARVHYYTASYSGDKCLIVTSTAPGPSLRTEIRLCRHNVKRVDGADLIQSAEFNDKQRASLEALLPSFYDNLAQYNVLCSCVRAARDKVAAVMYCQDRPGTF